MSRSSKADPRALAARLDRRAGSAGARLSFVSEASFGPRLRLCRYRLGNGLRVLLLADHEAPVISYHTWYRVGSRHERPGKTGLAHLFEHLMFNETESLRAGEFDHRIESAGGETNAATWTDWTQYHSEIPNSELGLLVALEAGRMQHLVLRDPQVRSEKEVVANERRYRVEDDVEGSVNEQLYAMAFGSHPYGWPTIGWMQDIHGFTTRDCERFYRTFYAPNNASLVIVGDLDEARTLSLLQRHYGSVARSRVPRERRPPPAEGQGPRSRTVRKPTPTCKLALGYHAPAVGDPDYAALTLQSEVLFGGRASRLFRRLVREEGLAVDVHGSAAPFELGGLYEIWLSLRQGVRPADAMRVLDEELSQARRQRVSDEELRRAKNRIELNFLAAMETAGGKADQLGFYETVLGDAARLFARLEEYRSATVDDLQRVARRVLDRRRRYRITVLPEDGAAA